MSQNVEEADLDFRHFRCCGDEDLYPFGCPRCGRLKVFCYECDTLHGDLHDLSHPGRWQVNNFDTSARFSPARSVPTRSSISSSETEVQDLIRAVAASGGQPPASG